MFVMAFKGWPVEAVEFYEDLEADNSKTFWQEHKSVYERSVKGPMEELLAELERRSTARTCRPTPSMRSSRSTTSSVLIKSRATTQRTGRQTSVMMRTRTTTSRSVRSAASHTRPRITTTTLISTRVRS
jgi:uncharacterized protein (DUF2461 family)